MKKKKLVMNLLLCLALVGWTSAVEVINIDINGYGDDTAYVGEGAYLDGGTEWIAYYGGWGVALGSQRTANLINQGTINPSYPDQPGQGFAGTYAEQVWIGDDGLGHDYSDGSALLDDGFVNITGAGGLNDPNIAFFGQGAYGGTFDMYVYGNSAGTFTIADGNDIIDSNSVTGTVSGFVEGQNYVIFRNVPLGNPNMIRLYYTNEINGIQLVSTKEPFAILPSTDPNNNMIDARNYDEAFDTNARGSVTEPETTYYGPDIGTYVHYLDTGEYMEYDITVDSAQGQYNLTADFVTYWGAAELRVYLDGILLGTLTQTHHDQDGSVYRSVESLPVNLFEGDHTLRWENTELYFDVVSLQFEYVKEITLDTCSDVYLYGLEPAGDVNEDCIVDIQDLAEMAAVWTVNYDPEAQ
ncbi:MAG: hypothetical protein JXA82_08870 [Sedimentisphaerales bacterium]|nr:hypothetical protein [Sedimentisphaerales bacterium]